MKCKICGIEGKKFFGRSLVQVPICRKCSNTKEGRRFRDNIIHRRLYGISLDDFENLCLEQKGRCSICKRHVEKKRQTPKGLSPDHNHETGEFRGALCHGCNTKLGWYESNKDSIHNYLYPNRPEKLTDAFLYPDPMHPSLNQ